MPKMVIEVPDQFIEVGIYDEAVLNALTIPWEAADRICGKRLKEAIPTLVVAMERYGHLQLETEVRRLLLAMSAATMDRLLTPVRQTGKQKTAEVGDQHSSETKHCRTDVQ